MRHFHPVVLVFWLYLDCPHIHGAKHSLKGCGCQARTQSCPRRNMLRGQICTFRYNQSPHKAILAFIPTGTRGHSLSPPSIMEMLRNERQEQCGCQRSSTGEKLGKLLQVQVGFQKLLSHCLDSEDKCSARTMGTREALP